MNSTRFLSIVSSCAVTLALGATSRAVDAAERGELEPSSIEREIDFNQGWRFVRSDVEGASDRGFDDSAWRLVDLPHDIGIEDLVKQDSRRVGPFYKGTKDGPSVGYLTGGVAWYRKRLPSGSGSGDQRVYLHFDGVQAEMTLYVNGERVGENVYGYSPFYLDLTDYLASDGADNVIAIKVVNPENNSRWYPGFGIYRDVKLSRLCPVHIAPWGIFVTTPRATAAESAITLDVQVNNAGSTDANATVRAEILDPDGNVCKSLKNEATLPAQGSATVVLSSVLDGVALWGLDAPHLYSAAVSVVQDGVLVDSRTVRFGIRDIEFSAKRGFLLNGQAVLLKGACLHHDNGILGAAAFRAAEFRRVRIMKENGFNAIRCSHNPPSSHFLDACDELGMLVIDEAFDMWERPKRRNDYHLHFRDWWKRDLRAMLLRDRNHPSIIMWSYGNEVQERCHPRGLEIARELVAEIQSLDTSRPTTQALCGFWDNRGMNWERDTPAAFEIMDIAGYNYKPEKYDSDHQSYPDRVMYGSESYPMEAWKYWRKTKDLPYVIGDFVWTGMDYIGESGIGISEIVKSKRNLNHPQKWPWFNANCGDIDLIGDKKPQSFYRDVVWGESGIEILVHEFIPEGFFEQTHGWGWPLEHPHWNWGGREGDTMKVNVYSTYPTVRVELNGNVIGEKRIDLERGITATFEVPYEPGILTATGISGEKQESKKLTTAGAVAALRITPEDTVTKPDRNAIVFLHVSAVDEQDRLVPTASLSARVKVSGAGELLAAGNAYPFIEGSFQDEQFRLHQGRALIVIRPTGDEGQIRAEVIAENGFSSTVQIEAAQ